MYKTGKHQYFTPKYTDAFSHYYGYHAHVMAVLSGSFIGTELIQFQESRAIQYVKKGRRFYIPFIIMSFAWVACNEYDNLKPMGSFSMMVAITLLLAAQLICRKEIAISRWNIKISLAVLLPLFFMSTIMMYLQIRREINMKSQKEKLESYVGRKMTL